MEGYRYMQDGGDAYDTDVFNQMIDNISTADVESDEEEVYEEEPDEEESNVDDEELIGSDFSVDREDDNDMFDEMLSDDSFNIPHEGRLSNYTKSFARQENKIEAVGKSQLERNKYAFDYFKKEGLNDVQAAAAVGNLAQESGIRALNYGDRDSTGAAQWRTDRRRGLNNWAKANGRNPNDLDTQLSYVVKEGHDRGDFQRIAGYKDVRQATIDFGRRYERPSEKHANWDNRVRHASSVLKMAYGGSIPYSQSTGGRVVYDNGLPLSRPDGPKIKFTPEGIPVSNPINDTIASLSTPSKITDKPDYLKVNKISGTGEYELPDSFKLLNNLAQGATFVANMVSNQRKRMKEQEQLEEEFRRPTGDNYGVSNISNIPSYNI